MSDITATEVMELSHLRSLLFCPADDERKLAKALTSGADGVVCDLEDAVAPAAKEGARETVRHALSGASEPARLLRVNGAGTAWFNDDVAKATWSAAASS